MNKMMIIVVTSLIALVNAESSHAQQQQNQTQQQRPGNEIAERGKFLSQCNPTNDQLVGAVCECVMESVSGVMSIAEFNRINELSKVGNVPPNEIKRFSDTLALAKKNLMYCVTPSDEG